MLHYLKIFSWFLLTFGVAGLIAIALGIDPGIGTSSGAVGLMLLQIGIAIAIIRSVKLEREGRLQRRPVLWMGWGLILLLVIAGQIWINVAAP